MTVKIFSHGMNDDVRTKLDGSLQIRTQKSIVDHHRYVSLICNLSQRGNVRDPQRGIRGRLDVQHSGVGAEGQQHSIRRRGVHKTEFQSKVNKQLRRYTENDDETLS